MRGPAVALLLLAGVVHAQDPPGAPATGQAPWLPRNGHTSVVFQDKMWVIGGWSHFIGGTSVNDLWSSGG